MMEKLEVYRVVYVRNLESALHLRGSFLGEIHLAELFVDRVVGRRREPFHHLVDPVVEIRRVFRGTGDYERSPGLVYENAVDLVHDGEVVAPLDVVLERKLHVVPQVVETELVVGPVRDVGPVGVLPGGGLESGPKGVDHFQVPLRRRSAVRAVSARPRGEVPADRLFGKLRVLPGEHVGGLVVYHPDLHSERQEDGRHPGGVPGGQIVVHGDEMGAPSRQGVEVEGQDGDQGLSLPCFHLRDSALVKNYSPYELDVEMPHGQGPFRRLPRDGESLGKNLLENPFRLGEIFPVGRIAAGAEAGADPFAKLRRLPAKFGRGKPGKLLLQGVYLPGGRSQLPDLPLVLGADYLFEHVGNHSADGSPRRPRPRRGPAVVKQCNNASEIDKKFSRAPAQASSFTLTTLEAAEPSEVMPTRERASRMVFLL